MSWERAGVRKGFLKLILWNGLWVGLPDCNHTRDLPTRLQGHQRGAISSYSEHLWRSGWGNAEGRNDGLRCCKQPSSLHSLEGAWSGPHPALLVTSRNPIGNGEGEICAPNGNQSGGRPCIWGPRKAAGGLENVCQQPQLSLAEASMLPLWAFLASAIFPLLPRLLDGSSSNSLH